MVGLKISGNQPLTGYVRSKVARSGLLLVLMSDWYLNSSWCRDELEWFTNTIRQERPGRPIFVVRVRATDHNTWPPVFKDERGRPPLATTLSLTAKPRGWGRRAFRPEILATAGSSMKRSEVSPRCCKSAQGPKGRRARRAESGRARGTLEPEDIAFLYAPPRRVSWRRRLRRGGR